MQNSELEVRQQRQPFEKIEKERQGLPQLKGEERMDLASQIHKDFAKGMTLKKLEDKYNLTRGAIKTLTHEWASVMRDHRPETRTSAEENMRELLAYCWSILDDPDMKSVYLRMKAMETIVAIQTRFDKWFGHETPQIHLTGDVKSAADLIREYEQQQSRGYIPPEDIVEVESYITKEGD